MCTEFPFYPEGIAILWKSWCASCTVGEDLESNAKDDDGHIIGSAPLQRSPDQLTAGLSGRICIGDLCELPLSDHTPQSVGAEDQQISVLQRDRMHGCIRNEFVAGAKRGGENMPLRM